MSTPPQSPQSTAPAAASKPITRSPGMIDLLIRKSVKQPIRALIIGPPKTGKTTFALTWPNPIIANFDNNSPSGVDEIPFWDANFINKLVPPKNATDTPNMRDAVTKFSRAIHTLEPHRTLIVDSIGLMESIYTAQEEAEPKPMNPPKDGKPATINIQQLFFRRKAWYETFLCAIRSYNGHVLALVHQAMEYDDNNQQTGMLYPAISGQMKSKLAGFFNNCWQTEIRDGDLAATPPKPAKYFIRLAGSNKLGLGTSFKAPSEYLPADYKAFAPYI